MYTCDLCEADTGSPENLTRVWFESYDKRIALLVCLDCLETDTDEGEYLTYAESDKTWKYGSFRYLV